MFWFLRTLESTGLCSLSHLPVYDLLTRSYSDVWSSHCSPVCWSTAVPTSETLYAVSYCQKSHPRLSMLFIYLFMYTKISEVYLHLVTESFMKISPQSSKKTQVFRIYFYQSVQYSKNSAGTNRVFTHIFMLCCSVRMATSVSELFAKRLAITHKCPDREDRYVYASYCFLIWM